MKTRRIVVNVLCTVMALSIAGIVTPAKPVWAHCQIPCGIYDDEMRFTLLSEHLTTIEKSITQIQKLSDAPGENANQLVRWVMNKENHADQFADIVTQYFLQQRIKPIKEDDDKNAGVRKLVLCHQMLVGVMKAKQSAELETVEALRGLLADFRNAYYSEEELRHLQKDHAPGQEGSHSP